MDCKDLEKYIAALALFDGYFDLRRRKEHIIIADASGEFLDSLCKELKICGVSCSVRRDKRHKMYRLRIYGKHTVYSLWRTAQDLLSNPDLALLAAAFDAEGSITRGKNQPTRIRIVQKSGPKADAIRTAIIKAGIPYIETRRAGGRYVEFVISNKEAVKTFMEKIKPRHPDKKPDLS